MPKTINILSDLMMKRIAAGEVVERPASAVKELLENSLDADANHISLYLKNAGIDLIQVVDNGKGMSEEDVMICCERHATSKIISQEDLDAIRTLGFRGEALASISSICRMVITSCEHDANESSQVRLNGGIIENVTKSAPRPGTSIAVKDLFFNVPARRKFIKTAATELKHAVLAFRRIAVSYPDVHFELYIDDDKTEDLAPASLQRRIGELLDEERTSHFLDVEKSISGIVVRGFISSPGRARKSRDDQMFFLNGRFITNRNIAHAVISGYANRISRDEYPAYILFLETDPSRVDVNVHPAKTEVRFLDERLIYDCVRRGVAEAFGKPAASPELKLISDLSGRASSGYKIRDREHIGQLTLEAQRPVVGNYNVAEFRAVDRDTPSFWQLHNRYILTQIKSGLIIIDQHIAHERILYEKALKSAELKAGISQQLLFPQTVHLRPDSYRIFLEMLPDLEKIGFSLKEFGKNSILIEAVPVHVKNGNEKDLLIGMIDYYSENRSEEDQIKNVAAAFACKNAVKSGDRLSIQEMASLIDQLFTTEEPYFCPHGRPVIINLPLDELDKRFGR